MKYKNGYKVVYEVAADGERTFYATKSNAYPVRDEDGNITDTVLASFVDKEFEGKTIYEHEGAFYVADTHVAKFDANGVPTGDLIKGFEELLVEGYVAPAATETPTAPAAVEPEVTEPEVTEPEDEEDETEPEE